MYVFQKTPYHSIEELYSAVSQEEIFRLVFREYPTLDKGYCSPFRDDRTPSCYFYWYNNQLLFVDWASDKTHRDGVQAVMDYYKFSSISEALHFIANKIDEEVNPEHRFEIFQKQKKSKEVTTILPIRKVFEEKDLLYWKRFGITQEQLLMDRVSPVSAIDLKKKKGWKRITFFDQAYCYELDLDIYKIYRPFQKGKYKWLSNVNENTIGNLDNLDYKQDTLIITKSYKDCRVLRNFGYESVWFQNEGMIPADYLLTFLISKYQRILILYDNDNTGRIAGKKLAEVLSTFSDSIVITTIESPLWYIKDISEMYCFKGQLYTETFLKQAVQA